MTRKSANTATTDKRRAPKSAWKPGQSGNPAGRPKDGESWASIIAAVGNMYPEDILEFVGRNNDLGREIVQLPKNVQMKYLVTARIFAALMFDPNPRLWASLMDRAEGKPAQSLDLTSKGESLSPALPDEERLARMKQLAVIISE